MGAGAIGWAKGKVTAEELKFQPGHSSRKLTRPRPGVSPLLGSEGQAPELTRPLQGAQSWPRRVCVHPARRCPQPLLWAWPLRPGSLAEPVGTWASTPEDMLPGLRP